MGIADIFRPKWKHSDAKVRISAVRALSSEDQRTLVGVIRSDADAAVRQLALRKTEDVGLLAEVAQDDADPTVREAAQERVAQLLFEAAISDELERALEAVSQIEDATRLAQVVLRSRSEQVRQSAFSRVADDRAVAEIAKSTKDPTLRNEALCRIKDSRVLRGLALASESRELALSALERLESQADIAAVCQHAKHKAARRRARSRLSTDTRQAANRRARREAHERQVELCRRVEQLTATGVEAVALLDETEAEMAAVSAQFGVEDEVAERFRLACEAWYHRREAPSPLPAAKVPSTARIESAGDVVVNRLSAELSCLGDEELNTDRLSRLRDQCSDLSEEHRHQAEGLLAAAAARHNAWKQRRDTETRAEALCQRLEALMERGESRTVAARLVGLESEWRELPKDSISQPVRSRFFTALSEVQQRVQDVEEKQAKLRQRKWDRVQQLLQYAERTEQLSEPISAERRLRQIQQALRDLANVCPPGVDPKETREQLQRAKMALHERVQELREAEAWKRWSNVTRREELCVEAEGLVQVQDLALAMDNLRRLQRAWREAGSVPRKSWESLSERFRAAIAATEAHCRPYLEQLERNKLANQAQKEKICADAEAMAGSTEWEETAEALKRLQRQWREIGPAPRQLADGLWRRFRAACDTFFDRREQHMAQLRQSNLLQKEKLCAEAEALAGSTDWDKTTRQLRQLQARWKEVGAVPRAEGRQLWTRFRAACDRFFEARAQHRAQESDEHHKRIQVLLERIESLVSKEQLEGEDIDQLLASQRQFHEAVAPSRGGGEAARERFRRALVQIVRVHGVSLAGTALDPAASERQQEQLCRRVESLRARVAEQLSVHEPDTTADPPPAQLAERIQSALAANTWRKDAAGSDLRQAAQELHSLKVTWRQTGPLADVQREEALLARFESACKWVERNAKTPAMADRQVPSVR